MMQRRRVPEPPSKRRRSPRVVVEEFGCGRAKLQEAEGRRQAKETRRGGRRVNSGGSDSLPSGSRESDKPDQPRWLAHSTSPRLVIPASSPLIPPGARYGANY